MKIHIVQRKDTLYRIAREYGISVARLISDNGLLYPYPLVEGQALIILLPALLHSVQEGETLFGIAQEYGLTLPELYQNNPTLPRNAQIYAGQELTIFFQNEPKRSLYTMGYAYPFILPQVLRRALPFLSALGVFSYGLHSDGSLIVPDDAFLLSEARFYACDAILVLTSLDETERFSSENTSRLLTDLPYQAGILAELLGIMQEKGYATLDMDFEYIPPEQAGDYLDFLQRAKTLLHAAGKTLSAALAPKHSAEQTGLLYEGHDYPSIGAICDRILLMTYEWGYTYSPPMAVAPLPQVKRVLDYGVSAIERKKILMGIPNYGYDWTLPHVPKVSRARTIGNQEAVLLAARLGASIDFSPEAQSPFFRYTAREQAHEVWFEDVRSIQAKYDLLDRYPLLGSGYWNIMRPFAQNWAFLGNQYRIQKTIR